MPETYFIGGPLDRKMLIIGQGIESIRAEKLDNSLHGPRLLLEYRISNYFIKGIGYRIAFCDPNDLIPTRVEEIILEKVAQKVAQRAT